MPRDKMLSGTIFASTISNLVGCQMILDESLGKPVHMLDASRTTPIANYEGYQ